MSTDIVALTSRVLIVIPTLGQRLGLLAQTLRSVREQEGVAVDIVVVTPQDALEARQMAREAGAEVVDDPGSQAAALNSGLAHARPEHIYGSWIGDDDLLTPSSLSRAVRALEADPRAVVAFGYCDYIDDQGRHLFKSRIGSLAPWLMTWGPDMVPQPGSLLRLEAVREVGGLDDSIAFAMDLDLLLRLRRSGKFVNTRATQAAFRWHPTSKTVSDRSSSLAESEMVKRRYLSPRLLRLAWTWERPVRAATRVAAWRVNSRALRAADRPA